jgi:CRP/FNR family cyclic AMP-dependent transcriptional regulator
MTDSFWGNIFKGKNKEGDIIRILKGIPIFEDLNTKELVAVERILHRREYKSDEVIFYQDDSGIGMYIIESGKVEISHEPSHQVLAELSDGEFFGEMALLSESPRSATAKATTTTKILFFSQSDLFNLIGLEIKCGLKIIKRLAQILGERLRLSNDLCQSLKQELQDLKAEINVK